jgi:hypothetical protein
MDFLKKSTSVNFFTLFFGAASLIFWSFFYNEHLYRLEQLQLFEVTGKYLLTHLEIQGGFSIWIAEFLTQFFRVPFAGAVLITLLLLLLQWLTYRLISWERDKPGFFILSFFPSAIYWVLLTIEFFNLSGLVSLIIAAAACVRFLHENEPKSRRYLNLLIIPVLWWITGAGYIVYTLCFICWELAGLSKGKALRCVTGITASIFIAVIVPLAARKTFISDTLLQSFVSESFYQVRILFPAPLIVLILLFPFLFLISRSRVAAIRVPFITEFLILALLSAFLSAGIARFGGLKQEKEIRYDNLVYEKKWNRIIKLAERENTVTANSVTALDLALAKTGKLSSEMFRYQQNQSILLPGYTHEGMTPFLTNEPYYYMGFINFAQMFAMETIESTVDARYPSRAFRRVAETFIINGQYENARRYLIPLSHTLFYRRWAKDCLLSLGNESEVNSHTEWRELRQLRPASDFFYNENQMDREMQMLMKANERNRTAFEYLMAFYLINKNFDGFLLNIHLVNNMNYTEMPLVFQEAAVFINSVSPVTPPQLQNFPVKNFVMAAFRSFKAVSNASGTKAAETTFNDFGSTCWYYIQFR